MASKDVPSYPRVPKARRAASTTRSRLPSRLLARDTYQMVDKNHAA
jgi:hypothetical protein